MTHSGPGSRAGHGGKDVADAGIFARHSYLGNVVVYAVGVS
jgi:hypothetical protein